MQRRETEMLKIQNKILREQDKFWCGCVFHPTDAIEDPWGKRILDQMAQDRAIDTVRIYSMFEDIVYRDAEGKLCYDFRLSDLRLDYMLEKGYSLVIAYAGIPDCIAASTDNKCSIAKGKTRYKGKMWNTSPPRDYALWEEICYEYTKHNIERYGIETVSKWKCQCFNEPDVKSFWLSELDPHDNEPRLKEYCKLYEYFQRGVRRASEDILVGGPAFGGMGGIKEFFGGFLKYIKANDLKLDFVTEHKYSVGFHMVRDKKGFIDVGSMIQTHEEIEETVCENGFGDLPIIMDEWGMITHGFCNIEECPDMMCRETEVFSAFYVRMIRRFLDCANPPKELMICLSGQHEMEQDFTGFRNFFTLNFIKKPIYNAHVMAGRLKGKLICADVGDENISLIPTTDGKGNYSVLLSYSADNGDINLPEKTEQVVFADDVSDKTVTVFCIDRDNTNPYRLFEREKMTVPDKEQIFALRREGDLKPMIVQSGSEPLELRLTANCTYLITVE